MSSISYQSRKANSTVNTLSYLGIKLDIYLRLEDFDQALAIVDQMEALTAKEEARYFAAKKTATDTTDKGANQPTVPSDDWTFMRGHIASQQQLTKGQSATTTNDSFAKEVHEPLITNFVLNPSYPNPFNPVTTISFELPEAAMVSVDVFNMTGQLVANLTNQRYTTGQYSLRFDATNMSTSVYLVRAVMGSHVSTPKITLIK